MGMPSNNSGGWEIDFKRKLAKHKDGLIVYFTSDVAGEWRVLRSNAIEWAKEDHKARAPLIPALLNNAIATYASAQKRRSKH